MRNLTTTFLMFFVVAGVFGQTTTKNYVQTVTAKKATTSSLINSNNIDDVIKTIQYYDGLGRPMQTVTRWGSPDGKDLVTPIAYDLRGREAKQYLPYATTTTNGDYNTNWNSADSIFYSAGGDNIANTQYYYSETAYETSPLSRVTEQAAPGINLAAGLHLTELDYELNIADEVKNWKVGELQTSAEDFYLAGHLYKTRTTDEDGNETIEFTDKQGRTVLKQSKVEGTTWAETYYIYDDMGRLRVVLPPQANEEIVNYYDDLDAEGYKLLESSITLTTTPNDSMYAYTFASEVTIDPGLNGVDLNPGFEVKPLEVLTPEFLADWAFQYEYDGRGRMISKQVPGGGKVLMVYDDRDRLVLTQDSVQRENNNNKWLFTKYDAFNRPVLTGETVINDTEANIRTAAKTVANESYDSGPLKGYTNTSYPSVAVADLLTVTYYDDHSFTAETYTRPSELNSSDATHILPVNSTATRGLVTGTLTEDGTGTGTFIETVTFYDDRQRMIQTVSDNHLGGTDVVSNQYDFVGNIRKTLTAHSDGTDTYEVFRRFEYDHMHRLEKTYHKVDDETEVLLSEVSYNERGEPIERDLHGGEQSVDYSYNVRGWLTAINDSGLTSTGDTNDDLFGMELFYDASSGLTGQDALYNGNISAIKWSNYDSNGSNVSTRGYTYAYDGLNRIEEADHFENGNNDSDNFNMSVTSYDLNGNIQNLDRYGESGSHIDDLAYSYTGNQLTKVDDTAPANGGFNEIATGGTDYTYDANGNMISDANKGITAIDYNHLNLPTKVTFDANKYIEYQYDAAGIKLQQKVTEGGSVVKTTDYVGEFIYEDDVLQLIQHEEGRVVPEWNSGQTAIDDWDYQYHLKDHLGNTRLTFAINPVSYSNTATYEDANVVAESANFGNVDVNRVSHPSTSNTGKAQRLNNGTPVGTYAVLAINKGDEVDLSVKGYYSGGSGYSTAIAAATFESALSTAVQGSQVLEGFTSTVIDNGIGAAITAIGVGGSSNDNIPGAYLNYLIFDKDMVYQGIAGFTQIPSSANGTEQTMTIPTINVDRDGFLIAYISNESNTTNYVHFDDFKVDQDKTNVVQADDYYPFGLAFNSSTRTASVAQNFRYNGKESINDLSLNWYDFGARMHMPDIGRFTTIDPLADQYAAQSPYVYAANNPIRFSEFNGMNPLDEVKTESVISSNDGSGGTFVTQTTTTTSTVTDDETGNTTTTTTTSATTNFVSTNEDGEVEIKYSETQSSTDVIVTNADGEVVSETIGKRQGTGETAENNSEFGKLNAWTQHIGEYNATHEETFNRSIVKQGSLSAFSSLGGPLLTGFGASLATTYAMGQAFSYPSTYLYGAFGTSVGLGIAGTVEGIKDLGKSMVHGISQSKNGVPLKLMKSPATKRMKFKN